MIMQFFTIDISITTLFYLYLERYFDIKSSFLC